MLHKIGISTVLFVFALQINGFSQSQIKEVPVRFRIEHADMFIDQAQPKTTANSPSTPVQIFVGNVILSTPDFKLTADSVLMKDSDVIEANKNIRVVEKDGHSFKCESFTYDLKTHICQAGNVKMSFGSK